MMMDRRTYHEALRMLDVMMAIDPPMDSHLGKAFHHLATAVEQHEKTLNPSLTKAPDNEAPENAEGSTS